MEQLLLSVFLQTEDLEAERNEVIGNGALWNWCSWEDTQCDLKPPGIGMAEPTHSMKPCQWHILNVFFVLKYSYV